MADSIPEELCSFGVTSKDFDEKKGVLTKTMETEVDEKEVFFSLFQDLKEATKAINYQILQMLYWNLALYNYCLLLINLARILLSSNKNLTNPAYWISSKTEKQELK